MNKRDEFLINLYNQLWNSINVHLTAIWHSIALFASAFAVFAMVEKQVFNFWMATSIMLIICIWYYCHIIDASFWYNRNLAIIRNIECQFLKSNDLKKIYPYFKEPRKKNTMIRHFKIQAMLGIITALLFIAIYIIQKILKKEGFEVFSDGIVFGLIIFGTIYSISTKKKADKDYKFLIEKSPGEFPD